MSIWRGRNASGLVSLRKCCERMFDVMLATESLRYTGWPRPWGLHPWRPEEQHHAVGATAAVLQRTFVQHQPVRHRGDRVFLTDDALLKLRLYVLEAVGHVAEHHVFRNLRHVRDDGDDVLFLHVPALVD